MIIARLTVSDEYLVRLPRILSSRDLRMGQKGLLSGSHLETANTRMRIITALIRADHAAVQKDVKMWHFLLWTHSAYIN